MEIQNPINRLGQVKPSKYSISILVLQITEYPNGIPINTIKKGCLSIHLENKCPCNW